MLLKGRCVGLQGEPGGDFPIIYCLNSSYLCLYHYLGHPRRLQHPVGLLIGLLCCLWIGFQVLYDLLRHGRIQVGRNCDWYLCAKNAGVKPTQSIRFSSDTSVMGISA